MPYPLETIRLVRENAEHLRTTAFTEADTISHLINPVLRHIGFPETQSRREGQIHRNRPDIVVWGDSAQIARGVPDAALI